MPISHSYLRLAENGALPDLPKLGQLGVAIVADIAVSNSRQNEIADWLYSSGCRYMAAWGIDCSIWDDALDWAQIAVWPDGAPDDQFIMTTWHDKDTMEQALWFIGTVACTYDDQLLGHILILHIGDCDRQNELKSSFLAALDI